MTQICHAVLPTSATNYSYGNDGLAEQQIGFLSMLLQFTPQHLPERSRLLMADAIHW